tara:strand:- start:269 stop:997 length:729 start_codon:yes stop_codon:yes gene_type:complete
MKYFQKYPGVDYFFGDEGLSNKVENFAIFSDVIDQIKDAATSYRDYYILPEERADQVSFQLYGTPDYYWTFYLMNNHIREQGWPLSNDKIYQYAIDNYTEKVLDTKTVLTDKYAIGESVEGLSNFATGTVVHRNLDLGQVWIKSTNNRSFQAGEIVRTTTTVVDELLTVRATSDRLNAVHHYENSDGEYVDIDPNVDRPAIFTEKTWLDELTRQNDNLKQIKVIRPDLIGEIVKSFNSAIRT